MGPDVGASDGAVVGAVGDTGVGVTVGAGAVGPLKVMLGF